MYPEGLRLRDRISHADIAFESLTKDITDTALVAIILLCQKYCTLPDLGETRIGKLITICATYESKHHPYSLIREEVKAVLSQIKSQNNLILTMGNNSFSGMNKTEQIDLCTHVSDDVNHQRASLYQLCQKINLYIDKDEFRYTEIIKR